MLKIEYGHFPWRLLYLPLAAAAVAGIAYVTFTHGWDDPIPPSLYWFSAAFSGWWAFLIVRSGVVPSGGLGPAIYRETSPVLFWYLVAIVILICAIFVFVAVTL